MARRSLVALALVAGLTCYPREARANHGGDGILATALVVFLLADAGFLTYDTIVAAQNDHPATGACLAEAIVATPQVLLYTALVGDLGRGRETGIVASIATLPSFLAVHGVWGAATKKTDPGTLYGVSWAAGANLAFTLPAVSASTRGTLLDRTSGVLEMMATTPQIVVATTVATRESGSERAAWYALDGWAGVLFVHGAASTIVGQREEEPATPPPPPVPVTPDTPIAPDAPTPSGPLEIETPEKEAPPKPSGLLVPGSLRVRPMAVQGGAGFSIGAILW